MTDGKNHSSSGFSYSSTAAEGKVARDSRLGLLERRLGG